MTLWQDIKYGFRMLVKHPTITLFAVLALALGIGANSVIFSIVNSLLMAPLPIAHPDRIMRIEEAREQTGGDLTSAISGRNYLDYLERSTSFQAISLITVENYNLAGYGGEPIRVPVYLTTVDPVNAMEIAMAKGRFFLPEEAEEGKNRVVMLNHGFWKERFGEDESVLGKEIFLNEESYTIVGIISPTLGILDTEARMWIPLTKDRLKNEARNIRRYSAMALLKDGVTPQQAQGEAAVLSKQLQQEYPDTNKDWVFLVEPIMMKLIHGLRFLFITLHGASGFLLLIACSNVAGLLLAKAGGRNKEIGVRIALGAGKGRILRQMLIESVMLSLAGGACGLLVTMWGIELMRNMLPPIFSTYLTSQGIDLRMLLFTLFVSIATGLLFGIAPALQSMRFNLNDVLKDSGRSGGFSRGRHRTLKALVVGEVALSLVLLIGAGLMTNSFLRMQNAHPGFRTQNLMTFSVYLPTQKYQEQERSQFFREAVQHISSIPGVEATAAANLVPFTSGSSVDFLIDGKDLPAGQTGFYSQLRNVNLDYFRVFDIPILRGEPFSPQDEDPNALTVIVDQTLAERYFPNEEPLGKYIQIPAWGNAKYRVIGIAGKVKSFGFKQDYDPTLYIPFLRQPADSVSFAFITNSQQSQLMSAIRHEIAQIDSHLPIDRVATMEGLIDGSMQFEKLTMVFVGMFSCVALFLSAVGIYGIISFSVNQQTHDIGIRMALGAGWRDVVRMVVQHGMVMTAIGILIGIAGSLAAMRILANQLYGVSEYDPMTFLYVVLLFLLVALLACYIPARRAAKVNPTEALRCE